MNQVIDNQVMNGQVMNGQVMNGQAAGDRADSQTRRGQVAGSQGSDGQTTIDCSANNPECVRIFTDGGCRGNPGPGGWGAILCFGAHQKEIKGGATDTTNNRMELTAAIEALRALKRPCRVQLTTDSQYVKKGVTEWLDGWKRRGWRAASGGAVKNQDLWEVLDKLNQEHTIDWRWVRGHSGHPENERADRLANEAMDAFLAGKRSSSE